MVVDRFLMKVAAGGPLGLFLVLPVATRVASGFVECTQYLLHGFHRSRGRHSLNLVQDRCILE